MVFHYINPCPPAQNSLPITSILVQNTKNTIDVVLPLFPPAIEDISLSEFDPVTEPCSAIAAADSGRLVHSFSSGAALERVRGRTFEDLAGW